MSVTSFSRSSEEEGALTIKLVFLGRLADLAGTAEQTTKAGSLNEVFATLPSELAMGLCDERVRMALNGQLVARDALPELRDGDELAFLPPVSGG